MPERQATITAVSHYVPEGRLTNADLQKMVDTDDQWIIDRTGIRERRIVEKGTPTSEIAARASRKVLTQRGIAPDEIDLIIVATVTPDMLFPSTACVLQQKIGASNAWGFDLSGACSGFLYALTTAAQFIQTGKHSKILVVGADVMSSIIDFEDRGTCVLFGDGAGAVLVEASNDGNGILDWMLGSDGSGGPYLYMPGGGSLNPASNETVRRKMHYVHQSGKSVFKFAVNGMQAVSESILERNGFTPDDVGLLVPHQANLRIIKATADKLKIDMSRVAVNIDRFANTTAATIPICLSEAADSGVVENGDLVLLVSFGAGFTWGSILLRWSG